MRKISAVIITKNSGEVLEKALKSVFGWVKEIILVDDFSKDCTLAIAKRYTNKIFLHRQISLGKQKQYAVRKAKNDWVLLFDADERISQKLKKEILSLKPKKKVVAFSVPFLNHFLGRKLRHGGENYQVVRLINKRFVTVSSSFVHEKVLTKKKKIGKLKGRIYHYSYRSFFQTYKKFTLYAWWQAKENLKRSERTSLKKIFFYPLHMFWARFVKDEGYKDGFWRIPLDLGFAYMELMTYIFMLTIKLPRILKFKKI